MSTLKNPQGILALVSIPPPTANGTPSVANQFSIVLGTVQDPGNLGTIIRTADWFGMKQIICSEDTADVFNPKVVQASMGSLAHVSIYYTDVSALLRDTSLPIYAGVLDGTNIYEMDFGREGLIVLGNEGNGLDRKLLHEQVRGITIPRFGFAESLNVAISAAIICSEVRRSTKQ